MSTYQYVTFFYIKKQIALNLKEFILLDNAIFAFPITVNSGPGLGSTKYHTSTHTYVVRVNMNTMYNTAVTIL